MRTLLPFCFLNILLFVILIPSSVGARDRFINIQEVTSESGITAWLVEDHSIPVLSMNFAFKNAGSAQDRLELQGLTQLASNTMDEGAGKIDAKSFQKELQDLAITLRFSASRDFFSGQLKTLTRNQDRAFSLLKLALTNPRFDKDAVHRMRDANIARIKRSISDPQWRAARIMNDKAFAGHPYSQNSGGTLSTLSAITSDDLRGFVKNRLALDNLIVTVAGDITAESLKTRLDDIFGALPLQAKLKQTPSLSLQNTGKIFVHEKDIPQTIITIYQPGISRKDPDYHTAQVMNYILGASGFGSRLMEEIREKRGLTYGIYSSFSNMAQIDILSVSTSTRNDKVSEMLGLIHDEWARMAESEVSQEELSTAQSYLIGSLPLSMTSTDKISQLLLNLRADNLPIDYFDQRQELISAVSSTDIQALAKELLDSKEFITILVGKPEGIIADEVIEDLENVE